MKYKRLSTQKHGKFLQSFCADRLVKIMKIRNYHFLNSIHISFKEIRKG